MADYYYSRTLPMTIEEADDRVREALSAEGFGVLTEIDVRETLRKKLDVEFRPYRILGACNPQLAHQALQKEPRIGTMLPCNVIIQETDTETTEVAAVDPVASMQAVRNDDLAEIAADVRQRLQRVIDSL